MEKLIQLKRMLTYIGSEVEILLLYGHIKLVVL